MVTGAAIVVCYQVSRAVVQGMKTPTSVEVQTLICVPCEETRCVLKFWVAQEMVAQEKRILLLTEKCCYLPIHFPLRTRQNVRREDSTYTRYLQHVRHDELAFLLKPGQIELNNVWHRQ